MVVVTVALVASLSGSAYAALGKNTVGPRQLKAKAVKTAKIANEAINGRKVRHNSLTGSDISLGKLGTVPAATALIRGVCYRTVVVDGTGQITEIAADNASRYVCVYALVR